MGVSPDTTLCVHPDVSQVPPTPPSLPPHSDSKVKKFYIAAEDTTYQGKEIHP